MINIFPQIYFQRDVSSHLQNFRLKNEWLGRKSNSIDGVRLHSLYRMTFLKKIPNEALREEFQIFSMNNFLNMSFFNQSFYNIPNTEL